MSTLTKPASNYSHLVCAISNLRRRTRSLRTRSPTEVGTHLISFQQTTFVWNLSSAIFSLPYVSSLSLFLSLSLSLSLSLCYTYTFIFYAKMYIIKTYKAQISLIKFFYLMHKEYITRLKINLKIPLAIVLYFWYEFRKVLLSLIRMY